MTKNCITKDTKIFEIYDNVREYNINDINKLNSISENISKQTGVPQELIYNDLGLNYIDGWYFINGEWYFFKNLSYDLYFLNELLGEVISKRFGLDTISYNVAKLYVKGEDEKLGVVSKNFCDPKYQYKRIWDYGYLSHK